jgi:hypothetical protein
LKASELIERSFLSDEGKRKYMDIIAQRKRKLLLK